MPSSSAAERPRTGCRIAFANHKGGTGKTTTCLSIAGYLAKSGRKVLVVDFDPQGSATSGLGIDKSSLTHTMYDAVLHQLERGGVPLAKIIVATEFPNLHLAPSEFDLSAGEQYMMRSRGRTGILAGIIEPVRKHYDYILIDLPPASGLLGINGLCAADQVVVPVEPSVFALETVDDLRQSFRSVEEHTGRAVDEIGAVLVRADKQPASREVERALRAMFATVFIVPAAAEIFQTQKQGVPISHLAPKSGVGKAYEKIARAVARHNQQTTKR